jgi:hypothetical protein
MARRRAQINAKVVHGRQTEGGVSAGIFSKLLLTGLAAGIEMLREGENLRLARSSPG